MWLNFSLEPCKLALKQARFLPPNGILRQIYQRVFFPPHLLRGGCPISWYSFARRSHSFLQGCSRGRGGSEHPDSDFKESGLNTAAQPPDGRRSFGRDSSPASDRSTSARCGQSGTAAAQ